MNRRHRRWLTATMGLAIPGLIAIMTMISGCAGARVGTTTPVPASGHLGRAVSHGPARYVFPVVGAASYARQHHDYPATDIMAHCGQPVVAVTDGVVLEVSRVDRWKASVNSGGTRGGLFVSIMGDDGVRYYGSHLSAVAAGLAAGRKVSAGQAIGKVGRTGDASACHLHFGISPVCARTGDWWVRRGEVWPAAYLDAWRAHRLKSPLVQVKAWQAEHGCPTRPTGR